MSNRGFLQRRRGAGISAVAALRDVADGALLLDVRRGGEWRKGHAAGAVHVPLDELSDRFMALPMQRPVIVLCRNGRLSKAAARLLARTGYAAWWVRGGLPAWAAAGGPVVAGIAARRPLPDPMQVRADRRTADVKPRELARPADPPASTPPVLMR